MKKIQYASSVCLVVVLTLGLISTGCSKPSPAPAPAPKPAPSAAPAPKLTPLQEIIEGAKKEGAVTLGMTAGYDAPKAVELLKKAISDKYGVNLNIKVQATAGMAAEIAKAVMETRTGTVATYDLLGLGATYIPEGTKAGIFDVVDWRSLFEAGTPREVQYDHPMLKAGVVLHSFIASGLMYNPQKVSAAEVPKKFSDLADPKWKGRLGMHDYSDYWVPWAFMLGKDNIASTLRSILKTNKPILDHFPPLNNRYLSGEIDLAFLLNLYIEENADRGKPTAWQSMDLVEVRDNQAVVRKGAAHPNAARLIAVFFASPQGGQFITEAVKKAHRFHPGNYLRKQIDEARNSGIPVYTMESYPGLFDFILSPEYGKWQKEFDLIIETAGK